MEGFAKEVSVISCAVPPRFSIFQDVFVYVGNIRGGNSSDQVAAFVPDRRHIWVFFVGIWIRLILIFRAKCPPLYIDWPFLLKLMDQELNDRVVTGIICHTVICSGGWFRTFCNAQRADYELAAFGCIVDSIFAGGWVFIIST